MRFRSKRSGRLIASSWCGTFSPAALVIAMVWCAAFSADATAQARWRERSILRAPDAAAGDDFSAAVALDGDWVVIGAPMDDDNGADSGAVYVFSLDSGDLIYKLVPADGAAGDNFGSAVAVSGNIAAIGAKNDLWSSYPAGSAYVFDLSTGEELYKVLPTDGYIADQFGAAVALSEDRLLVGAPGDDDYALNAGTVYVFRAVTGGLLGRLFPSGGAAGGGFGNRIAVQGNVALVGAQYDAEHEGDQGAAYLFDIDESYEFYKWSAPDGHAGQGFGSSVSLDGTRAVVGAFRDHEIGSAAGAVYLFDTTTGAVIFKLLADDELTSDRFGNAVAIEGTRLLIGAPGRDDLGSFSGAAYLFDAATGTQVEKFHASDGQSTAAFGNTMAMCGDRAVIGAHSDPRNGAGSGAAYTFAYVPNRLAVEGTCPGTVRVAWADATPNRQQALLFGRDEGELVIPPGVPCAGTRLGVQGGVRQVGGLIPTRGGSGSVSGQVDASACGRFLQLIESGSCNTSNVASIP